MGGRKDEVRERRGREGVKTAERGGGREDEGGEGGDDLTGG